MFSLDRRRRLFVRSTNGRRDQPQASHRRGKYTRARLPSELGVDVALDATIRAAAGRLARQELRTFAVSSEDLREKARHHRSSLVVAFVLDNSWSIHVETTVERTKGVVLELLKDARIHRDKVSLVAFRHSRRPDATVCLPPTRSYSLALERLRTVPVSGSTPLSDGIRKAHLVLRNQIAKYHNAIPVMVVVSDGLPNVPIRPGADPFDEVALLCRRLRWEGIATVVVDTGSGAADAARGNCREMAYQSNGRYLTLEELSRCSIMGAIGGEKKPSADPRVGPTRANGGEEQ